MDKRSDQYRQTLGAILGIGIIMCAVAADVRSEMKFTENTRNGIYERAYQQAVNKPKE